MAVALIIHVCTAVFLFFQNRSARPVKYAVDKSGGGRTFSSQTMPYTGLLILGFIGVHLATFSHHIVDQTTRNIFQIAVAVFSQQGLPGHLFARRARGRLSCPAWSLERLSDGGGQPSQVYALYPEAEHRLCRDRGARLRVAAARHSGDAAREVCRCNLMPKFRADPWKTKWDRHRFDLKLVNPANKRKFEIIVVGTGLAGGSASASLAELGYNVKTFCIQDSPRRAHSIAAQGGINAAKNYPNDGDSVWRLFYDTIKGGDFRAREANVYRLAQVSNLIIDHCVAQGIPFAREYGGLLANRSFGGAQVSRTFYARGQTGQQLLLGAYSSLMRQVARGQVTMFPRREMLDLVLVDGQARGIVVRNLITGEIERHTAHAVVLATGGYANVFYLSTNGMGCNVTAAFGPIRRGPGLPTPASPRFIPPAFRCTATTSPSSP